MSKKNLPYKFTNLAYGEYADYCKCPSCNREMLVPCGVTICPICGEVIQWNDDEPELPSGTPSEPIQATITSVYRLYHYDEECTLKGELIANIGKAVDDKGGGMIDLAGLEITIPCLTENGEEYISKSLMRNCHGIVLEVANGDVIPIEVLTADTLMRLDTEIEDAGDNICIY